MRMRILIGLAMALLLGGCVSPSDLERNEPSIKVSTKKEPKQYALCVLPRWQDARSDVSMSKLSMGTGWLLPAATWLMSC